MENERVVSKRRVQTGRIWSRPAADREHIVSQVCQILEENYGKPRFGNPTDPLDDLIYVILSNKTAPRVAQRIYTDLESRFDAWDEVLSVSVVDLIEILRPAGLAAVKARQIRAALEKIRHDFSSCNLGQLRHESAERAEEYLVSLPGVSLKVAKCVMMYTLGAEVLPVDSHVHRVTRRLGWTDHKRADQCHEELEALVSPELRYALHVDCIAHGRSICRPEKPSCELCCVNRYCAYFNDAA